jgi:hypothetical protein
MKKQHISALNKRFRGKFPIIRLIHVCSNNARITDFNVEYVIKNINAPDGYYGIEGTKLVGIDSNNSLDDFPRFKLEQPIQTITLGANVLTQFFNYASIDETKESLNTINFEEIDGNLSIVSTNGYILMSKTFSIPFKGKFTPIIKNIMESNLKRLSKQELKITFYEKYTSFAAGDEEIIVKNSDGFPDYKSVISNEKHHEIFTIQSKELKRILEENKIDRYGDTMHFIEVYNGVLTFHSYNKISDFKYDLKCSERTFIPSVHDAKLIMSKNPEGIQLDIPLVKKMIEGNTMTFYHLSNNKPIFVEVE